MAPFRIELLRPRLDVQLVIRRPGNPVAIVRRRLITNRLIDIAAFRMGTEGHLVQRIAAKVLRPNQRRKLSRQLSWKRFRGGQYRTDGQAKAEQDSSAEVGEAFRGLHGVVLSG